MKKIMTVLTVVAVSFMLMATIATAADEAANPEYERANAEIRERANAEIDRMIAIKDKKDKEAVTEAVNPEYERANAKIREKANAEIDSMLPPKTLQNQKASAIATEDALIELKRVKAEIKAIEEKKSADDQAALIELERVKAEIKRMTAQKGKKDRKPPTIIATATEQAAQPVQTVQPVQAGSAATRMKALKTENKRVDEQTKKAVEMAAADSKVQVPSSTDTPVPAPAPEAVKITPAVPQEIAAIAARENTCSKPAVVTIKTTVKFATNKATLKTKQYKNIKVIGKYLKEAPTAKVVISGFADNVGSQKYNKKLSLRRAESAMRYIAKHYGIAPERITTVGYGKLKPVASNKTKKGRAQNRRIEIEITC